MMRVRCFTLPLAALSLCAVACSDPVAPPAQGAMGIQKGRGTGNCIQNLTGIVSQPPTAQDYIDITGSAPPSVRVIDGKDNAKVECTVSGSGSFAILGKIETGLATFDVNEAQADSSTGTALISEWDSVAQDTLSAPRTNPCTLEIKSIQPGAVWARFNCPEFNNPQSMQVCNATGAFVFENCTK